MFNKAKYEKCIGHLVSQKFSVIFTYLIVFAAIGAGIGCAIMFGADTDEFSLIIGLIVGAVIGIITGISATWRIEMKIQEAYWRIDMLQELQNKNLNLLDNKKETKKAVETKEESKE